MKRTITFIAAWLYALTVCAQVPQSFTYQAVVRNDSNKLVTNARVSIRAAITDQAGNTLYQETHRVETNENGLLTVEIGAGENVSGSINNLNWGSESYYLNTLIDPNGGTNYAISITQRLLSVPYALYADKAGNVFSGNYDDLNNLPTLFSGEWDSLRHKPDFAQVAYTGSYQDLTNKPNLHTVATSGNYYDLNNKPVLFSGSYNDLTNKPNLHAVATSGNYNVLENKPTIPTVPSNVSSFNNDASYITHEHVNAILNTLYRRIDSLQQFISENITCCSATDLAQDTFPSCPNATVVIDYDGNTYHTVQIGQQCWLRENLKCTHAYDGSTITGLTAPGGNVDTYGYLYTWDATMNGGSSGSTNPQGICPDGWHIPSSTEWGQLSTYVGSQSQYRCGNSNNNIAKALASTTGWAISNTNCAVGNNQDQNNATGLAILPAGGETSNNTYFGLRAYLWTSTAGANATYFNLTNTSSSTSNSYAMPKTNYASVRCLKNN